MSQKSQRTCTCVSIYKFVTDGIRGVVAGDNTASEKTYYKYIHNHSSFYVLCFLHLFQLKVSETKELFALLRHTEIVHFVLDSVYILPFNPPHPCRQNYFCFKTSWIFCLQFLLLNKKKHNSQCMLRNIYFSKSGISEAQ